MTNQSYGVKHFNFYIQKLCYFLLYFLFCTGLPILSQQNVSAFGGFKSEQKKFVQQVKSVSLDSSIVYPIARYVDSEISNIYRSVTKDRKLSVKQKDRGIKSMVFFMTDLGRKLQQQKFEVYDVPAALESYKNILSALNKKESLAPLLSPLDPREIQLMTVAFGQYDEYNYLEDVAVYKRVASSPEFIMHFLETKPGFRFMDSLLLAVAMHDPMKLVNYLNRKSAVLQSKIRSSDNRYIQQIVSVSGNKNASEIVPFLSLMIQGKLNPEDIIATRMKVTEYFQMLVNSLIAANQSGDRSSRALEPLRSGIQKKSLSFYVNQVNELHDASDATRFASVKQLRPEDIYYIITSTGEDMYTSSYLGLYKRMKSHFTNNNADSIFDIVGYDNFHVFMRLAANYNVLADFLHSMPQEKAKGLLNRFIDGIGDNDSTAIDRAMDIADSFGALTAAPELISYTESELKLNLARSKEENQYRGARLYNILLQVFELVKEGGTLNRLWAKLGNYEVLRQNLLANDKGEIVELVLFYGDEDGIASFRNFSKSYSDTNKWKAEKNRYWVSYRSVSGVPVVIYANLPLDISEELDRIAQDSLVAYMKQRSIEPAILMHRGHSYHLDKTLNRLQPSVNLAILGSCGGYNKAISIANINPDVHVIGSKKTGSQSINDPMLDVINNSLVDGQDLVWSDIWKQLNDRFSKDPAALSLFYEYFPPSHNLGLFVLKLFRSNHRSLLD